MGRYLRPLAAVLAATVLAWSALSHALVTVTHSRNPAFALRFDAADPVALARKALADQATHPSASTADRAVRSAQTSIRELALNPRAFELLGLVARDADSLNRASERMAFSSRLSRRQLTTQLWLIEEEVRRNDVSGALEHYDFALRTSPASEAILFPVLTKALDQPIIRQRLVPLILARPPWLERFFQYAIANSTNPRSLADLVIEAGGFPAGPKFAGFGGNIIRRLAQSGDYRGAVGFYRRTQANTDAVLGSAELSPETTDPTFAPMTWQPFVTEGLDATLISTEGNAVELVADMDATFAGAMAQKVLTLGPGRYNLAVTMTAVGATSQSTATWQVVCANGGAQARLFSGTVPLLARDGLRGEFTVPASCATQVLQVSGVAGAESGGVELTIGPLAVTRQ